MSVSSTKNSNQHDCIVHWSWGKRLVHLPSNSPVIVNRGKQVKNLNNGEAQEKEKNSGNNAANTSKSANVAQSEYLCGLMKSPFRPNREAGL